jgi:hypothetical protein
MSLPSDELAAEPANPFATRFIRPGAVAYVFDQGQSVATLIERLARLGWWGQIIGPHGSGKSTLLAQLAAPFEQAGRRPAIFALHDGQRRMPSDWPDEARRVSARLIVVDGYEQLSRASRFWLKRRCRREGWGLLVTAHRDVGLETVFRTQSTLATTQAVVGELLAGTETVVGLAAVARCFAASSGNVRETLFALYDYVEQQSDRR